MISLDDIEKCMKQMPIQPDQIRMISLDFQELVSGLSPSFVSENNGTLFGMEIILSYEVERGKVYLTCSSTFDKPFNLPPAE